MKTFDGLGTIEKYTHDGIPRRKIKHPLLGKNEIEERDDIELRSNIARKRDAADSLPMSRTIRQGDLF